MRALLLILVGLHLLIEALEPRDLLERQDSDRCRHGCTLNLSAASLAQRKYTRLWRSPPHWQEWQRLGVDAMRRLRQPQSFKGGEVVIDIGSYIGADLVSFLRRAPLNVTVHTFEPVAEYRTKLATRVQRLVHHGRERLHVHPVGLGRSDHAACFAPKRAAATDEAATDDMSIAQAASKGTACGARIRDAAVALQSFSRVDVMQINCEGCEYDILERLIEQQAVLQVIRSLEVQFHLDRGVQNDTTRYCRIESGLRSRGFQLDYRHPFLWERWTRRSTCNRRAYSVNSTSTLTRSQGGPAEAASPAQRQVCAMPWDWPARASAGAKARAVIARHTTGRGGNKLFVIAASVALADVMQLPLVIPRRTTATMSRSGFPCLRTSPSLHGLKYEDLEQVHPNGAFGYNFQDLSIWGTAQPPFLPLRPPQPAKWLGLMRRAFRPMVGGGAIADPPADDDLVIHFRDVRDCSGWKPTKDGNSTRSVYRYNRWMPGIHWGGPWFYHLDLYAPPVVFFDSVIAMHASRFPHGRLWLVSQPCDRNHPTVKSLIARWPMHVLTAHDKARNSSALLDFVWMQAARHLVLSPSTFGWWSAFLSARAATIHFPLYAAFSAYGANMWCHLVPEDDARYEFHDVWTSSTWRGGGSTGREARRRCDVYVRACLQAHVCATNAASAAKARVALPIEDIDNFTNLDSTYSYIPSLCWRPAAGSSAASGNCQIHRQG